MHSINGRLYFDKNLENQYIFSPGPISEYRIKYSKLVKIKPWSIPNMILWLTKPIDVFRQSLIAGSIVFLLTRHMQSYSIDKSDADDFLKENIKIDELPAKEVIPLIEKATLRACKSMEVSILASLAHTYGVRMKLEDLEAECECEKLYKSGIEGVRQFSFHSLHPYDISYPRFSEFDMSSPRTQSLGRMLPKCPSDKFLKVRENAKFICSRYLSIARKAYWRVGQLSGLGDLVFHLRMKELMGLIDERSRILHQLASKRKEQWLKNSQLSLPNRIIVHGPDVYTEKDEDDVIAGTPAGGSEIVSGRAVFVRDERDFGKVRKGDIVVSESLSPNLTAVYPIIAGIISKSGGMLAHAALVARESNIPCVVGTHNFKMITEGSVLCIDGKEGRVTITSRM